MSIKRGRSKDFRQMRFSLFNALFFFTKLGSPKLHFYHKMGRQQTDETVSTWPLMTCMMTAWVVESLTALYDMFLPFPRITYLLQHSKIILSFNTQSRLPKRRREIVTKCWNLRLFVGQHQLLTDDMVLLNSGIYRISGNTYYFMDQHGSIRTKIWTKFAVTERNLPADRARI